MRTTATGFAAYPDVTVVCGQLELDPEDANTATNPRVVVEIPSPSTEHYDRGEKLRQYRQVASLAHIVLVAHDSQQVDVWSRDEDTWKVSIARSGEQAMLDSIGCVLDVDAVYRDPLNG